MTGPLGRSHGVAALNIVVGLVICGAALGALMGAALGESKIPPRLIEGLADSAAIKGEIDAFVHDAPTIWSTVGRPLNEDEELTGLYRPLTHEYLAWAVKKDGGEALRDFLNAALVRWQPGTRFPQHIHPGGEEIFVLDGVFEDEQGAYPAGTWLRNPPGSRHAPFSRSGCLIWVKTGHLAPPTPAMGPRPGR
jgi:hypothetical protein